MPSKIRPDDWDRLFAPNAPRRGGPLRALVNVLLTLALLAAIGIGAISGMRYNARRTTSLIATATSFAATNQPLQTATAQLQAQRTAARLEARTATALAAQGTPESTIGRGTVRQGGNLRKEPRIADDTVIGLIWPGDQVVFLKQQLVGGQTWFHVRVVKEAENRAGSGVAAGTDGWASASLLSAPVP